MIRDAIVALITPFDEKGNVNYNKLLELIDYQINNRIEAILFFATTGEGSTLTIDEKTKIARLVTHYIKGRVQVLLTISANNIKDAIYQIRTFSKYCPDCFLITSPFFNKGNSTGIIKYYEKICDYSKIPLIIYNIPSRSGFNIPLECYEMLSKNKKIVGVKEASNDIEYTKKIVSYQNSEFKIYCGNDLKLLDFFNLNITGVISVFANTHPDVLVDMINMFKEKKNIELNNLYNKYQSYIKSLSIETNPIPIKEAMNILKFNIGEFRLPLDHMSQKHREILEKSIGEIHE